MPPPKKHSPWRKAQPEEVCLYTLPPGVKEKCKIREDKGNQNSSESFNLFIGTDMGVFFAQVSTRKPTKRSEAEQIGLEEFCIDEIVQQGQDILAHSTTGEIFIAPIYALKGVR